MSVSNRQGISEVEEWVAAAMESARSLGRALGESSAFKRFEVAFEAFQAADPIGLLKRDGNRIRALLALTRCRLCVSQIVALLQFAPSTVSKHLSILRQANLVESRREGRGIY